jgi:phage/plasmid-associated DNA primase
MPELDFSIIEKTGTFKSATGHDPLLIEFKNKGAFTFYNYAKVTISTNSIPITTDKTDGYHRRILIIDFPNKFKEKYDLLSRIPEKEFENLALKSIRIAKELLKKGSFTNEGTIEERKAKYEKISNPIATFLDENVTEAPDMYISKKEFNFELNKWLNKHRHRNLTNKEIHKVMSDIYQEGWRGDSDKDGKTTGRIWQGLYWKDKLPKINKKEEYVNDI